MSTATDDRKARMVELRDQIAHHEHQGQVKACKAQEVLDEAIKSGINLSKRDSDPKAREAEDLYLQLSTKADDCFRAANHARSELNDLVSKQPPAVHGRGRGPWLLTWSEYRAQTSTTTSTEGILTPPAFANYLVDDLRPANVVLRSLEAKGVLGVPTFEIIENTTQEVPKIGSTSQVSMVAEAATIPSTQTGLERVVFRPKKLAAIQRMSNELLSDSEVRSNATARRVAEIDLARATANKLDHQFLEGDPTGQPASEDNMTGLRNMSDLGEVIELGSGDGGPPSLQAVKDAVDRHEQRNTNPETTVLFMHGRSWAQLTDERDNDERFQLQPDPTEASRRWLFDREVFVSNQISTDEEVGVNDDATYVLVVDLGQVGIRLRSDVRLFYDPFSRSDSDETLIRLTTRWDIQALNPEAISLITGVRL